MSSFLGGILFIIVLLLSVIFISTPYQRYSVYTHMMSLEKWGERIISRGASGRNCGHGSTESVENLSHKVAYSQCIKQSILKKIAHLDGQDGLIYAIYRGSDKEFTCEIKIAYFPKLEGAPSSCGFSIFKTEQQVPLGTATGFISPPDRL